MNFVSPIRKKQDITAMKKYLKKSNLRNYTLFVLGINSALRISDLLGFFVSDVQNLDGTIKERVSLKETKTGKTKILPLNDNLKKALSDYLEKTKLPQESVLFPSREGLNQSITRQTAHIFLHEAALSVGIKEQISTHSCRKTWAYQIYTSNIKKDPGIINVLQKALNHSSSETTLRYIGIERSHIENLYMNNAL